jgi:O-antigen ligase
MTIRLPSVDWRLPFAVAGVSILVGLLAGINPELAIAASLAIGFALIVIADLAVGLALFTTLSLLEVFQAGSLLSVGKIGGVFLALAWLARVVTRQDSKSDFLAVHPGMTAVISAFLGWTLLSAVWAESPSLVIGSFGRYLLNAILFLIVFTAVRTRRQAVMVAAAFVIGGLATSVYGLATGPGGPTVTSDARLAGSGVEQGELAAVLIAGIALSAGVAGNLRRNPGLRLATVGAGALCLLGLFLTVSRGGLLGLGLALIAALFFSGRWRTRVAVVVALIAVTTVYYFAALAPQASRDRITQTTSGQTRLQEGRTTLWKVAERMAKANLIKGVGAGNFRVVSVHYLLEPGALARSDQIISQPLVAHNTFLEILAEEGIVGLSLFVSIVLFSLVCTFRATKEFVRKRDVRGEVLARTLLIGLVGVIVADTFLSQEYNKQLWLLLALGPALLSVARTERMTEAAT